MAYRYEVSTYGSPEDSFAGNATVFEGKNEASAAAYELASRWTGVRSWRVVETDKPVNYRFYRKANKAVPLSEAERTRRVNWKRTKGQRSEPEQEQECPICGDYDDRDHVSDPASPCYAGG